MSNRKALTSIESVDTRTGEIMTSNPITGLVHITGEHDTGKSLFALTCGISPERMAFLDGDVKGRATVNQIGVKNFAMYRDLVREGDGMREVEFHTHCLGIIAEMNPKAYDVIVWDNWTPVAKTCHPFVVENPTLFKKSWSPMGQIKGAEMWGESFNYEGELLDRLLHIAPLVIITTHLKAHRVQVTDNKSVITGKQIPDCSKAVVEKSNFRVWLRHNPSGNPVPVGLVLKRLSKYSIGKNGGLVAVNVLPRRLDPCDWQTVLEYWEHPMGDRNPLLAETPTDFELSLLDGTLTADQKDVLNAGLKGLESETGGDSGAEISLNGHTPPPPDELTVKIRAIRAEHPNKTLSEVARELGVRITEVSSRLKTL